MSKEDFINTLIKNDLLPILSESMIKDNKEDKDFVV